MLISATTNRRRHQSTVKSVDNVSPVASTNLENRRDSHTNKTIFEITLSISVDRVFVSGSISSFGVPQTC
jgi:hypothetical protein